MHCLSDCIRIKNRLSTDDLSIMDCHFDSNAGSAVSLDCFSDSECGQAAQIAGCTFTDSPSVQIRAARSNFNDLLVVQCKFMNIGSAAIQLYEVANYIVQNCYFSKVDGPVIQVVRGKGII